MAYNVNDTAKLKHLQALAERTKADYEAKIAPAFKSAKVEGNTVYLYTTADQTGEAAFSFDFPVEQFLDQAKTTFVPEFAFSEETYPGAEDPNLEGKPVMVLAVKGTDGETETVTYSFVDMAKMMDTYTAKAGDGSATVTVDGYEISVNVNVSAEAGNALQKKADGLHVDISGKTDKVEGATEGNIAGLDAEGNLTDSGVAAANVATKVAGAVEGNLATLDANGNLVDSGSGIATDEEVEEMLNEIFPAE